MVPDPVTEAHLEAVRRELHAEFGQHKAEVTSSVEGIRLELKLVRGDAAAQHRNLSDKLDRLLVRTDELETVEERQKVTKSLISKGMKFGGAAVSVLGIIAGIVLKLLGLG